MSRYYELAVEFKDIDVKHILNIVSNNYGWEEEYADTEEAIFRGSLYGGTSEEDAFKEMYDELKKIEPKCKIRMRFTYLEELPSNIIGDDLE